MRWRLSVSCPICQRSKTFYRGDRRGNRKRELLVTSRQTVRSGGTCLPQCNSIALGCPTLKIPPYQVRGRLIKSGMTVCVVIPANPGSGPGQGPGIQRNGGSTLLVTHYWLLSFGLSHSTIQPINYLTVFYFEPWTLDSGLVLFTHHRFWLS